MRPEVSELYDSKFAQGYDLRAKICDHLVGREILESFHSRLLTLDSVPHRVLDLGCGTGRNLRRFAAANVAIESYEGVDCSPRMVELARARHPYSRASFEVTDATTALGSQRRYSLITAAWLLSHLASPAELIEAATASLEPGGRFLALAITDSTRLKARACGWRFRRNLHASPVSPELLRTDSLSFEHVSANGLMTLVEYRPHAKT